MYVAATVMAIRLPGRVDSTAGELDLDGTRAGEGPLPLPSATRGARRPRRCRAPVRYVLWLTTGARLLSGFLTLFLAFLMREHPLPGWSGPGRARHGRRGGRRGQRARLGDRQPAATAPPPSGSRPVVAGLAVVAALLTAVFYSLPTLVLLGLATGLFGQLAKLSLDALIQRDVDDHVRARVFSWSETILQAFWVVGGAIGITLPLLPVLGFAIVTAVVVLACLVALRSRRLGSDRLTTTRAARVRLVGLALAVIVAGALVWLLLGGERRRPVQSAGRLAPGPGGRWSTLRAARAAHPRARVEEPAVRAWPAPCSASAGGIAMSWVASMISAARHASPSPGGWGARPSPR